MNDNYSGQRRCFDVNIWKYGEIMKVWECVNILNPVKVWRCLSCSLWKRSKQHMSHQWWSDSDVSPPKRSIKERKHFLPNESGSSVWRCWREVFRVPRNFGMEGKLAWQGFHGALPSLQSWLRGWNGQHIPLDVHRCSSTRLGIIWIIMVAWMTWTIGWPCFSTNKSQTPLPCLSEGSHFGRRSLLSQETLAH